MSTEPSRIPVQPPAFRYGLPNTARCLRSLGPLKIVAIGSSTTAGEGGIVAYPYRLEALLRERYQTLMIDVLNRGIGGEEAPAELARLDRDVIAERPSLVIWQVGTNAAWQEPPTVAQAAAAVREGLQRLRAIRDMDVVLMDLQYTPAMLTSAKIELSERMVSLIEAAADEVQVNVFRRFAMMKAWHEVERISFDRMVDPSDADRLHDSDWATQRIAWCLREAIAGAVALAAGHVPAV